MCILASLENVCKDYHINGKTLPVLRLIPLTIKTGQQVALVGHSGAGKTTLLNILAGLTLPTSGRVTVNGQELYTLDEAIRDVFRAKHIGYVFQTFNLVPGLTALENVMLPMYFAQAKGDHARRAKGLLDQVQLTGRYHHKPKQLSRGEQQRVAVARALANKAPLILADEPTGNVDKENSLLILQLIQNLCREHQSALLLVTHNSYVQEYFPETWEMEKINFIDKQPGGEVGAKA